MGLICVECSYRLVIAHASCVVVILTSSVQFINFADLIWYMCVCVCVCVCVCRAQLELNALSIIGTIMTKL